mmetsp:Transcript_18259/g.49065  ORF Transcript_18259/g.49065 Transcript_18259/m.49065 type:complete len:230 (-) Transcript_18259:23-712(-)
MVHPSGAPPHDVVRDARCVHIPHVRTGTHHTHALLPLVAVLLRGVLLKVREGTTSHMYTKQRVCQRQGLRRSPCRRQPIECPPFLGSERGGLSEQGRAQEVFRVLFLCLLLRFIDIHDGLEVAQEVLVIHLQNWRTQQINNCGHVVKHVISKCLHGILKERSHEVGGTVSQGGWLFIAVTAGALTGASGPRRTAALRKHGQMFIIHHVLEALFAPHCVTRASARDETRS